ncbi:MAG: VTT domain-containing protein [Candidatus Omnitrophica bacterium]|nr:VTT domain-containing protein [Candidatus Omnitrophota bacterium]
MKIRFLIFLGALIVFFLLGKYLHLDSNNLQASLLKIPIFYSGLLFILLYVVITFFVWLSKDIFYILGVAVFGPYISAGLIYLAEVINAFILFWLARYLGRGYVEGSLGKRYKNLDERLGNIGFIWLFIFRATPIIPYRFLDLASGLTRISFLKYILAVISGSPLKVFWVQYIIGAVGKDVFDPHKMAEYFLKSKILFILSLIYIILVIVVTFKIKRIKS